STVLLAHALCDELRSLIFPKLHAGESWGHANAFAAAQHDCGCALRAWFVRDRHCDAFVFLRGELYADLCFAVCFAEERTANGAAVSGLGLSVDDWDCAVGLGAISGCVDRAGLEGRNH